MQVNVEAPRNCSGCGEPQLYPGLTVHRPGCRIAAQIFEAQARHQREITGLMEVIPDEWGEGERP